MKMLENEQLTVWNLQFQTLWMTKNWLWGTSEMFSSIAKSKHINQVLYNFVIVFYTVKNNVKSTVIYCVCAQEITVY